MTEEIRTTIKARGRQGTDSLDLTIPVEVRRKYNVSPGDVFEMFAAKEGNELRIKYRRVFSS